MTQKPRQSLVDEAIWLLVKHFGADQVRAALARASSGSVEPTDDAPRGPKRRSNSHANPPITGMLEQVRQRDEEKYRLLAGFFAQLKDRTVLPDSQDIRHFAQLIGLKEIRGKSRKDLVPRLMRFLIEQPTERLQMDIDAAPGVTEEQRQRGFSVITDKLLGGKPQAASEVDCG